MNSTRLLVVGVALLATIYLSAPEIVEQLSAKPDPSQNRCTKIGVAGDPDLVMRPNPGRVVSIRLTRNGEFVDRCELTDALYEMNWDVPKPYGPRARPDAPNLPRLAILYIHGWKHSAAETETFVDTDLVAFKALVQSIQATHNGTRQVVGIYVGWEADSGLGALNNLTFWSKAAVADRIAQTAVVTKIIASLGATRKINKDRVDQFIAIGHSFGARLLFSATNQSLITDAARAHPGVTGGVYQLLTSSADATILLNPAFEAARFTPVDTIGRFEESFLPEQPPLLVSISTTGDWATRMLFPLGQWIGMDRTRLTSTTLGNYELFQTHELQLSEKSSCLAAVSNGALTEAFFAEGLCLSRKRGGTTGTPTAHRRYNPFMVVRTDPDVIADHNDIWNPRFAAWLGGFVTALEKAHRSRLQVKQK